jgi:hypothetical protein
MADLRAELSAARRARDGPRAAALKVDMAELRALERTAAAKRRHLAALAPTHPEWRSHWRHARPHLERQLAALPKTLPEARAHAARVASGEMIHAHLDLTPATWCGPGVYEGPTVHGRAEGEGTWVGTGARKGDRYEGHFRDGWFDGEGTYTDHKGLVWHSGHWHKGFNTE